MQSRRGFLKRLAAAPVVAAALPAIASALVTAEQLRFPSAPAPAPPVEYMTATSSTSGPMFSQLDTSRIMAEWVDRGPWKFHETKNGPLLLPRPY